MKANKLRGYSGGKEDTWEVTMVRTATRGSAEVVSVVVEGVRLVCRLGKADLRLYATRLGASGLGPCLQSQTKGSALMLQLPMALMLRRHRRKPTLVCRLSRGNSSLKTDRDWWSWPSTSLLV
jgi:hypothetical protein